MKAAFTHRRQLHEGPKRVSTGTQGPEPGAAAEVPVDPKAIDAWAAKNAIHAIDWASAANSSPILRLKHPTEGLLAVVPAFTARGAPIEGEQRKRAMDQHLATSQAKEPRTASTSKLRGGAAAASKPPASAAASSAGTSS